MSNPTASRHLRQRNAGGLQNLYQARFEIEKIAMQPKIVLTNDETPEFPDSKQQKIYKSFVAKTHCKMG